MMKYGAAYGATLVVLLVLDLVWLAVIAKPLYREGIGHLMAENADLRAALVFYLVYVTGLIFYGVLPHAETRGLLATAKSAAIFGFFVYAVYDLTNMAVLRNWPLGLSMIDVAWGTCVSALSAVAGKFAFDRLS
jgi:uncharacterized membrane protein